MARTYLSRTTFGSKADSITIFDGARMNVVAVDRTACVKAPARSDTVHARQKTPDPGEVVGRFELRRAPALPRIQRETETGVMLQCGIIHIYWRDDGQFRDGEFGRERMFLEDGRIAPAPGAIKLGHDRRSILDAHLIHAILETVQREQTSVGIYTGRFDGIDHRIRA